MVVNPLVKIRSTRRLRRATVNRFMNLEISSSALPSSHSISIGHGFVRRAVTPGRDESGQVTLLAAMVCFLTAFLAIIAFNTNEAIRNRIIAQNAVDSAASSAALWQARGCNLVQTLNNVHYTANQIAAGLEVASAAACVLAEIPWFTKPPLCALCATLPVIDGTQQALNYTITNIQQVVVNVTPLVAFLNANASARGSGAGTVQQAVAAVASGWLERMGLGSASSLLGSIGGPAGMDIPFPAIYAAPINPASLSLYVDMKKGTKFPWTFTSVVGLVGHGSGKTACPGVYDASYRATKRAGWNGKWGWNDYYFRGNPGYMTWIAGTASRDELLGFGNLAWLNGGHADIDGLRQYTGNGRVGKQLRIPGFLALASSQVEGTPVIDHGDANAKGKLIKVYITSKFPGDSVGILH